MAPFLLGEGLDDGPTASFPPPFRSLIYLSALAPSISLQSPLAQCLHEENPPSSIAPTHFSPPPPPFPSLIYLSALAPSISLIRICILLILLLLIRTTPM